MKITYTLLAILLGSTFLSAQCGNPDLQGLSWSPNVPGTQDIVRFVVAKEYMDGCSGLAEKGDAVVDHDARTITLYFDQFCQDTMICSQDVHCDTAHYIVSGLDLAMYNVIVVDTVSDNYICATGSHEDTLDNKSLTVRDVVITSDTVIGKPGTIQCIPYVFDGFQDVNTFQASISWDTFMLRYDTVRNLEPISFFSPASVSLNFTDDLRVIWFDFDVDGESVADGTTLFEVCFELIGNDGDTSAVYFNRDLLNPEIEDVAGDTLAIIENPGQIIISDDRYPDCTTDTADLMCQEWVMDTVLANITNFCDSDSGYFRIEVIDWRGWNLVKFSRGFISNMGPIGDEMFFACDGEPVGFCSIGGIAGGFCSNESLGQDTSFLQHVWECGETLPGCYTTSSRDVSVEIPTILRSNLSDDILMVETDFHNADYQIMNTQGQLIDKGQLGAQLDIRSLTPGVYWIRSNDTVEAFVRSSK